MEYQNILALVQKRRSCRRFKSDPIPDEDVDKIIEVARWAPSGGNSQPWEFIIVKKATLRQKIAQFIKEYMAINYKVELTREPDLRYPTLKRPVERYGYEDAPVFVLLCGDRRTKQAYPLYAAAEREDAVFESSLASAFLYMHLAATSLGLGSQWITAVRSWFVQCLVKDLLGIPEEIAIYDMMAVGYPAMEPPPRAVRAREEMVHRDYYDKTRFRNLQEIREFIVAIRKGRTYSGMGSRRSKGQSRGQIKADGDGI